MQCDAALAGALARTTGQPPLLPICRVGNPLARVPVAPHQRARRGGVGGGDSLGTRATQIQETKSNQARSPASETLDVIEDLGTQPYRSLPAANGPKPGLDENAGFCCRLRTECRGGNGHGVACP